MVDRLVPLPAAEAGGPGSILGFCQTTIRVEKLAHFGNPTSGGHVTSTEIALNRKIKKIHKQKQRCSCILRPGYCVPKDGFTLVKKSDVKKRGLLITF
jgi:hypothetical protein